jgi:uncharacterized surface protein with fasciclin (FAS1) repeats
MKRLIFYVSLVLTGLMASCVDKNEEVDANSKPEWLGSSIYEELKNPNQNALTGSFNTYLRLVDDLDYAETLARTGSKTIFAANDEAFARFFEKNEWGVTSYEQLSDAQKKVLLYSSMLDNALLISMLPNTSSGTAEVVKGMAVKHNTALNVIDTITHVYGPAGMPANNKYWAAHTNGFDYVSDATRPMMVHLTKEYLINNSITTIGEGSDFEILTGTPYKEGAAYIFNNQVVTKSPYQDGKTCQNGYIHQVKDVLLPPGNMAQVLRKDGETSLFSRVLDYFCAPYYDAVTTNNYNSWALANNKPVKDSIFQIRYFSTRSSNSTLTSDNGGLGIDPSNVMLSSKYILSYDPGWNGYYPKVSNSTAVDRTITDIGAFFVPDDKAMKNYFLPGGNGAYLMDIYGYLPNTEDNLKYNLDSLFVRNPQVLKTFIANLQKASFSATVPSKFSTITNDATENMGMKIDLLKKKADGKYDIKIANNGVVYVLNEMIAPDEYQAVLAPSSSYKDMQVMNWAVQDRTYLGVDFKFYLLAMGANYAFFIPEDSAFSKYMYVDPATLGHDRPEALHFYNDASKTPTLRCDRYYYDAATNQIGSRIGEAAITAVKSQLIDILNFHTVVLETGETFGRNNFYKTKHGGEIRIDGASAGAHVMSGAQIDNGQEKPEILAVYNEKNGKAFRLNRVIEAPRNSVYKTLSDNSRFSEFVEACSGFDAGDLLKWAGISDEVNAFGTTEQDRYTIFTANYKNEKNELVQNGCLDNNVKMFNTFNYTLYAPSNSAMEKAYAKGLPRWSEIQALFERYHEENTDEATAAKDRAFLMITALRNFVRYHFQNTSLYADNATFAEDMFPSLCSDALGVAMELRVSGGGGKLAVKDVTGTVHAVDAGNAGTLSNMMARDYWFDKDRRQARSIITSSFCAVHEIDEPFYLSADKRYDGTWSDSKALAKTAKVYRRLLSQNKL